MRTPALIASLLALTFAVGSPAHAQSQQTPVAARIATTVDAMPLLYAGVPSADEIAAALDDNTAALVDDATPGLQGLAASDCGAMGAPELYRWWGLYGEDGFVVYGQVTGCVLRVDQDGSAVLFATLDTGADAFNVEADWVGVALPSTAPERDVVAVGAQPTQLAGGVLRADGGAVVWDAFEAEPTSLTDTAIRTFAVPGEGGDAVILVVSDDAASLWAGRAQGAVAGASMAR